MTLVVDTLTNEDRCAWVLALNEMPIEPMPDDEFDFFYLWWKEIRDSQERRSDA